MNVIVYAIGTNVDRITSYCKKYSINCFECNYLNVAVEKMDINMDKNSIGILSPAAASLDQFKSYAHRGDEFKKFVNNLS